MQVRGRLSFDLKTRNICKNKRHLSRSPIGPSGIPSTYWAYWCLSSLIIRYSDAKEIDCKNHVFLKAMKIMSSVLYILYMGTGNYTIAGLGLAKNSLLSAMCLFSLFLFNNQEMLSVGFNFILPLGESEHAADLQSWWTVVPYRRKLYQVWTARKDLFLQFITERSTERMQYLPPFHTSLFPMQSSSSTFYAARMHWQIIPNSPSGKEVISNFLVLVATASSSRLIKVTHHYVGKCSNSCFLPGARQWSHPVVFPLFMGAVHKHRNLSV